MRESLVEKTVVEYARSRGWLAYKWSSPGTKGVHDHIFFKNGVCFTIEFKAPGKKATVLQRNCAKDLQKVGVLSALVDEIYKGKRLIDDVTCMVDATGFAYPLNFDIDGFNP